MPTMSTTTEASSAVHTSDSGSVTSDSYTESSFSTADPPSHLKIQVNNSGVSGISDPSAVSSAATVPRQNKSAMAVVARPVFSPVLEETNSALDADADGISPKNSTGNNNPPKSPAAPMLPLECNYDECPSELYQAIEAKRWDVVLSLISKEPTQVKKEAATWVVRKEPNGRIRWRLLPVHAAVIFQAPAGVVEKLLRECPQAAQAKDDQGMLPLHLAFRTKVTCWETVEELVTLYPQAVLVKDRKGRTPLECGLASATAAAATESATKLEIQAAPSGGSSTSFMGGLMSPKRKPVTPRAHSTTNNLNGGISAAQHKAMFSVLELYSQACSQEQIQNAMNNSRKALETRIGAVQDSHVQTLTQLKKGWETQRNDLNRKMQGYRKELQTLKADFNTQQELLEEKVNTEMELVDRLHQVTTALENKTGMSDEDAEVVARDISKMQSQDLKEANKKAEVLKATNKELLLLLETLLDDQNALKTSLDKLSWDTKTKNDERKDLLNKYFIVHEQSVEMAESYTQEWQQRLEQTSMDVSDKLSKILSQNKMSSTRAGIFDPVHDEYDGEEKKDAYNDITLVHSSSLGSGAMAVSSRQDP